MSATYRGNEMGKAATHQVHVDDLVGDRADGVHDERADGDVRDEAPVHHVDVNPLGTGLIDGLDLRAGPGVRTAGSGSHVRWVGKGPPRGHAAQPRRSATAHSGVAPRVQLPPSLTRRCCLGPFILAGR